MLVYLSYPSQFMSIMQPTALKRTLCSCELGLLERLIIPRLPKWIDSPKLRALWMSQLHLSSVRHTAGLCLSPLRTGSGMPPTWIKSRPSTDGPNALQACQTCQRLWLCCIKDPLCATAWIHNLNRAIFGCIKGRFDSSRSDLTRIKSNQIGLFKSECVWTESRV